MPTKHGGAVEDAAGTTQTPRPEDSQVDSTELSPAELLARLIVLTPSQFAYVAGLTFSFGPRKGEPNVRRALELIHSGAVRPVDPKQPTIRLRVSTNEARHYLEHGPREVEGAA